MKGALVDAETGNLELRAAVVGMSREELRQALVRPPAESRQGQVRREFLIVVGCVPGEGAVDFALQHEQRQGWREPEPEHARFPLGGWKDTDALQCKVEGRRANQGKTPEDLGQLPLRSPAHETQGDVEPVSYTHLTLPTNREV